MGTFNRDTERLIWKEIRKMNSFITLLPLLTLGQAAHTSLGSCPSVPSLRNFELERYMGAWYEYSNTFETFQIASSCVRAQYALQGERVSVLNEQISTITGDYVFVNGTARPADPADTENKAEYIVAFYNTPFQNPDSTAGGSPNYRVVSTDYDSYALVYTCNNFMFLKKESLWVLTREQKPTQELADSIYQKVTDLGISTSILRKTSQKNCSMLPSI